MENKFDITNYLRGLSIDLVNAFDKAGIATHPQAVGSGREKSIRDQLQRMLPTGIGVGSGFVIDSYGNISKQCDIILYEKEFSLKFSPNDDDQYIYYNCENVIAVGEVKSIASSNDIKSAIFNLKSIRELKRYPNYDTSLGKKLKCYRPYLSNMSIAPTPDDEYDQENKYYDQIFTFLICKSFDLSTLSILKYITKECENKKYLYPNCLLSVDDNYSFWLSDKPILLRSDHLNANIFTMQKVSCSLEQLIVDISGFIKNGRSVPNNSLAYFSNNQKVELKEPIYQITEFEK